MKSEHGKAAVSLLKHITINPSHLHGEGYSMCNGFCVHNLSLFPGCVCNKLVM